MTRRCERPDCAEPAEVAYRFDPITRVVTLLAFADVRELGALCRHHADGLVVPRGWWVDDQRDPTPMLFRRARAERASAPDPAAAGEPSPAADGVADERPRRTRSRRAKHAEVDAEASAVVESADVPDVELPFEPGPDPSAPVVGPAGRLAPTDRPADPPTDRLEDPSTPLLSRAFRASTTSRPAAHDPGARP